MIPIDITIIVGCSILLMMWNLYFFNQNTDFRFSVTRHQFRFWLFVYNVIMFLLWFIVWYFAWRITTSDATEHFIKAIGIANSEIFGFMRDFLGGYELSTNHISFSAFLSASLITYALPSRLSFVSSWIRREIQDFASFSTAVNEITDTLTKEKQLFVPGEVYRKSLEICLRTHDLDLHDFLDHRSDAHRLWAEIEILKEALINIKKDENNFIFFKSARANAIRELEESVTELEEAMFSSFQLTNSLLKRKLPVLRKEAVKYLNALVGTLKQYRRRIVSLIVEALITQGYSKKARKQFFRELGYIDFEESRTGLSGAEIVKVALIIFAAIFVLSAILADVSPHIMTRQRAIGEALLAFTILPSVLWANVKILFRLDDHFKEFRLPLYFMGAVSAVPITYFWAALWGWLVPNLMPDWRAPLWTNLEQLIQIAGMLPFVTLLGIGVSVVTDPRGFFTVDSLRKLQKRSPERIRDFARPTLLRCIAVTGFALLGVALSAWASPMVSELSVFGTWTFMLGASLSAIILGSFLGWVVPRWCEEEREREAKVASNLSDESTEAPVTERLPSEASVVGEKHPAKQG